MGIDEEDGEGEEEVFIEIGRNSHFTTNLSRFTKFAQMFFWRKVLIIFENLSKFTNSTENRSFYSNVLSEHRK